MSESSEMNLYVVYTRENTFQLQSIEITMERDEDGNPPSIWEIANYIRRHRYLDWDLFIINVINMDKL
jgi:hypothetical protein